MTELTYTAELTYTSDVDFDAVLADGSLVHIRPPVTTDRAALLALHARLSERSSYFRYFSLSRHAGEAHVDHLLGAYSCRRVQARHAGRAHSVSELHAAVVSHCSSIR
jgi:hypothetical protein